MPFVKLEMFIYNWTEGRIKHCMWWFVQNTNCSGCHAATFSSFNGGFPFSQWHDPIPCSHFHQQWFAMAHWCSTGMPASVFRGSELFRYYTLMRTHDPNCLHICLQPVSKMDDWQLGVKSCIVKAALVDCVLTEARHVTTSLRTIQPP